MLFSTFHVEQPETLIVWKFKSVTNQRTDGHLTWVGARDACASKNKQGNLAQDEMIKQKQNYYRVEIQNIIEIEIFR